MKNSDRYRKGLQSRNTVNGMKGRKNSKESKRKMSISRTGKIGKNTTGWKGGKCSLVCRIKGRQHNVFNWYYRVYQRDHFKCCVCSSNKKIQAHHIEPVHILIKRLCNESGLKFENDDDKFLWLSSHPEIEDKGLDNGITLCYECHRKIHINWGSYRASVVSIEKGDLKEWVEKIKTFLDRV